MEELELNRINANSPYIVELDFSTGLFKFVSDFGVSFSVAFEKDNDGRYSLDFRKIDLENDNEISED